MHVNFQKRTFTFVITFRTDFKTTWIGISMLENKKDETPLTPGESPWRWIRE